MSTAAEVSGDGLAELGAWLSGRGEAIGAQVLVEERADGLSVVRIDHRLSCDLAPHAGWHVKTKTTHLPGVHFPSYAAARVNGAASHGRGRALYCHDPLAGEVTAALAYHLDARHPLPLLVTAFAFRKDTAESDFRRRRTLAAGLVLKYHLHAIAAAVGRGGHVDIDLADRDDQLEIAALYGFRPAPKIRGFRPSAHHLRQPAPVPA